MAFWEVVTTKKEKRRIVKWRKINLNKLKSEGWEYLTDYSGVAVDRLYDNWSDILNANNRKRLEDTTLSDN